MQTEDVPLAFVIYLHTYGLLELAFYELALGKSAMHIIWTSIVLQRWKSVDTQSDVLKFIFFQEGVDSLGMLVNCVV